MTTRRQFLRLTGLAPLALSHAARADAPLRVVATFSILGDFARQVGGERVSVATLVGPNGDAHVFEPSPADSRLLSEARAIVVNGLGLEGWLERLIQTSGAKAPRIVASKGVTPLAGEGEERGKSDPHAWQDVANAKIYVANIRDGFTAADPGGKDVYAANAAAYLASLDALEAEVRAAIAKIPPANRRIITTHDAFGYFGKAHGMEFIAPQGVSTESEASARDVGKIIRQIKAQKIPAVFLENVSDPRLIRNIAKESGARIGKPLFSDALSPPDGPAATYVAMMRNNIAAFVDALAN
jgi:zinc/manganese transport system substrate-binding protein